MLPPSCTGWGGNDWPIAWACLRRARCSAQCVSMWLITSLRLIIQLRDACLHWCMPVGGGPSPQTQRPWRSCWACPYYVCHCCMLCTSVCFAFPILQHFQVCFVFVCFSFCFFQIYTFTFLQFQQTDLKKLSASASSKVFVFFEITRFPQICLSKTISNLSHAI